MLALEANIELREGERAVVFVDVDCFKAVNDEHGHAVGDELLRAVARRLQAGVREGDMVGRIGGDEFLVVCPDIGGADSAMRLAERLSAAVRHESIRAAIGNIAPQVSIGVAWSEGDDLAADAIVLQADAAMYESKRRGTGEPQLANA
jgi:diguanylate cyclase (GGDEF)-like protein